MPALRSPDLIAGVEDPQTRVRTPARHLALRELQSKYSRDICPLVGAQLKGEVCRGMAPAKRVSERFSATKRSSRIWEAIKAIPATEAVKLHRVPSPLTPGTVHGRQSPMVSESAPIEADWLGTCSAGLSEFSNYNLRFQLYRPLGLMDSNHEQSAAAGKLSQFSNVPKMYFYVPKENCGEGLNLIKEIHTNQSLFTMNIRTLTTIALLGLASNAQANLLRNPSFENVPGTGPGYQDQGLMPSDWVTVAVTPDTYSTDGSYGLPPSGFGNFDGVAAQDGLRWVAGWSDAVEVFGQALTAPLTPGTSYSLSGYLHQAYRGDLNNPGGYDIYLTTDSSYSSIASGTLLGRLASTTSYAAGWGSHSIAFTAPANAGTHPFLSFVPVATSTDGYTYPGLDNLSLTPVPEPSTWLAGALLSLPLSLRGWHSFRSRREVA